MNGSVNIHEALRRMLADDFGRYNVHDGLKKIAEDAAAAAPPPLVDTRGAVASAPNTLGLAAKRIGGKVKLPTTPTVPTGL